MDEDTNTVIHQEQARIIALKLAERLLCLARHDANLKKMQLILELIDNLKGEVDSIYQEMAKEIR